LAGFIARVYQAVLTPAPPRFESPFRAVTVSWSAIGVDPPSISGCDIEADANLKVFLPPI